MPTATFPPNFFLRHPTLDELTYIRTLHASCWAGPLTVPQYLSREVHIASTPLTRDGGLTQWVLVDLTSEQVLASCETIRKVAAMSSPSINEEKVVPVEEVVAYGIGSVFTPPECRGRGYARIMLTLLGERLKYHNGEVAGFSALYSDIGKVGFPVPKPFISLSVSVSISVPIDQQTYICFRSQEFYTKLGWLPHRSSHIDIPVPSVPTTCTISTPRVEPLYHDDISALCALDIAAVKANLSMGNPKLRIAFLPDHDTLNWHHNREEFIAGCVRPTSGIPRVKGSITRDGLRWILWGRDFSPDDPKLYILRVVNLGDQVGWAADMDSMLRTAVEEAAMWGLRKVCVWNPDQGLVESAKRVVGSEVQVEDREMDSIASLMMYGEEKVGSGVEDVEWVVNEKFGWC